VRARYYPACALHPRILRHGRWPSVRRWDSLHSGRRPVARHRWRRGPSKEQRSLCDDHQCSSVVGTPPTCEDPCRAGSE
jgi:hypothetical protein